MAKRERHTEKCRKSRKSNRAAFENVNTDAIWNLGPSPKKGQGQTQLFLPFRVRPQSAVFSGYKEVYGDRAGWVESTGIHWHTKYEVELFSQKVLLQQQNRPNRLSVVHAGHLWSTQAVYGPRRPVVVHVLWG